MTGDAAGAETVYQNAVGNHIVQAVNSVVAVVGGERVPLLVTPPRGRPGPGASPSRLLRGRSAVVGFVDRSARSQELTRWAGSGVPFAVTVLGGGEFADGEAARLEAPGLGEQPGLVRIFGLDPARISQYAFAIGSAIVVPGAIFTSMTAGLNPASGAHVMLIRLAATIVGGIGSLRGAAYGGILLGLAENLSLWRLDAQWSEAVTFVVLFLFIIFRPAGFFGRPHGAK